MAKIKLVSIAVLLSAILFLGYNFLLPKYKMYQDNLVQEQKLSQIKELTLTSLSSAGYPDEKKVKEDRKHLCELTARSTQEREKTVLAIKAFIDNPSAEVTYQCNDSFYDTTNDKFIPAKSETYTVGINTFIVNPLTDHVVQADIKEYTSGAKNYSQEDIESMGKDFINAHQDILGQFDLSKLSYEINKKSDGTNTNYFLIWTGESKKIMLDPPAVTCSRDLNKDVSGVYYQADGTPCIKTYETTITPTLQIAINSFGQILNYTNSFEGDVGRAMIF